MPEWLLAVLVFGTMFGLPIGWGMLLWLTPTMGFGWETLVAIALVGYGIYLLWPGRRSFWIVF